MWRHGSGIAQIWKPCRQMEAESLLSPGPRVWKALGPFLMWMFDPRTYYLSLRSKPLESDFPRQLSSALRQAARRVRASRLRLKSNFRKYPGVPPDDKSDQERKQLWREAWLLLRLTSCKIYL